MINIIKIREDIPSILSNDSIGCELGVFEGVYSQILVDSGKFKKLYLVDTFSSDIVSGDKRGKNRRFYQDGTILYEYNKQKFMSNQIVEIVRQDSVFFLSSFTNFFDFVYIDTLHTYDFTFKELEAAYIATKAMGFICGHDYHITGFPEVVRAVKVFTRKYNLKYFLTTEDTLESFIIQKL